MEFLSAATGKDWVETEPNNKADQNELNAAESNRLKLNRLLTDVLLSENLLVLAGLGTSLCVKDEGGVTVAPTMLQLWEAVKGAAGESFDQILGRVRYRTPATGDNIELLLSQCQLAQRFDPQDQIERFVREAEGLIVEKCKFVRENLKLPFHEMFLRKVARRSTRNPRLKLFTTNYDLVFEAAASRTRFVVVDGFSHTQPQEFDGGFFNVDFVKRNDDQTSPDFMPNVFHLCKLHGSIDWELRGSQVVKSIEPVRPLIVYPRQSKFESSYDQPFIELMSRLQGYLRQPNTGLIIVGFGFNDNHITQPILSAVRSNVGLKAVVVDPAIKKSKNEAIETIRALILNGDWRLAQISAGFEALVPFMPDLVVQTEEEQHLLRLRASRNPA